MKKFKQALGGKKKDKDAASISSKLSECAETGYEVKSDAPKLHKAAWSNDLQKVKELLSSPKAVVDAKDSEGRTALLLACARGHVEVVKELLAKGAEVGALDRSKKSALRKAVDCRRLACVQLLVGKVNVSTVDQTGDSMLHHAVRTGDLEVVRAIVKANARVDMKNREGFSPFLLAVKFEHVDIVDFLLKNGANGNSANLMGR